MFLLYFNILAHIKASGSVLPSLFLYHWKGREWEKKIKACLDLIQSYLRASSSPFPMDRMKDHAAFFNIDTTESQVHSLACHDGSVCIEDVPIYSILSKRYICIAKTLHTTGISMSFNKVNNIFTVKTIKVISCSTIISNGAGTANSVIIGKNSDQIFMECSVRYQQCIMMRKGKISDPAT